MYVLSPKMIIHCQFNQNKLPQAYFSVLHHVFTVHISPNLVLLNVMDETEGWSAPL